MHKRRHHLFEFSDQSWLPGSWRQLLTEILTFQARHVYRYILPKLAVALRRTKSTQVIDLCSGNGGPWPMLNQLLRKHLPTPISITLTDLFPENRKKIQDLSGNISYHTKSINALHVPEEFTGFRTLFTSFHHFRPSEAQAILSDAAHTGAPIAIFEFTERRADRMRDWRKFPKVAYQILGQSGPLTFAQKWWTYIIPIIPLIYTWDAWVSHARSYTLEELQHMTTSINHPSYVWETGKTPMGNTDYFITYVLGRPSG